MVELECPNCGNSLELREVDQTDEVTQFSEECRCGASLTLIVRIEK